MCEISDQKTAAAAAAPLACLPPSWCTFGLISKVRVPLEGLRSFVEHCPGHQLQRSVDALGILFLRTGIQIATVVPPIASCDRWKEHGCSICRCAICHTPESRRRGEPASKSGKINSVCDCTRPTRLLAGRHAWRKAHCRGHLLLKVTVVVICIAFAARLHKHWLLPVPYGLDVPQWFCDAAVVLQSWKHWARRKDLVALVSSFPP